MITTLGLVKGNLDHLHEGFRRLLEAGLTLQASQCPIIQKEVHYVSRSCGGQRVVNPDPRMSQCVQEHSPAKDQEGCQSLSWLGRYYRHFDPGYSTIAVPLSDLTWKGKPSKSCGLQSVRLSSWL